MSPQVSVETLGGEGLQEFEAEFSDAHQQNATAENQQEQTGEIPADEERLTFDAIYQAVTAEYNLTEESSSKLDERRQRRAERLAAGTADPNRRRADSDGALGAYLDRAGEIPLLTADDERKLAQSIERRNEVLAAHASEETPSYSPDEQHVIQGGDRARDRFISSNLLLVVSIAKRYPVPPTMEFDDLVEQGNLGLERAVEKFDWRKGTKFSTYATDRIKVAISRHLDEYGSLIRLPAREGQALRLALRNESEEQPLSDEHRKLNHLTGLVYADQPIGDDHDAKLFDLIPSNGRDSEEVAVSRAAWQELSAQLDDISQEIKAKNNQQSRHAGLLKSVVVLREGLLDGNILSFEKISKQLGISIERAKGFHREAISGLKRAAEKQQDGEDQA